MNIDYIKSVLNVSAGPSLRCNYLVTVCPPLLLKLPEFLGGQYGGAAVSFVGARQVSILALNASLPGRVISTTPHRMYGTVREMPYGVLYAPMQITFLCTNSMLERTLFNIWQENIMNHKSYYMNYYNDYVGSIVIQKMSDSKDVGSLAGEVVSTYVLEEAYPKIIAEQELSYGSKNEYMTLTVEFSYARWKNTLSDLETFAKAAASVALDNIVG